MNRKIILALPIAVCGLAFGAGGASAAQFVTNGGFETSTNTQSTFLNQPDTSVTGWTSTGDFVLYCTAGAGTTCDETSILGGAALGGTGQRKQQRPDLEPPRRRLYGV
jgi:hypothetical protein